MKLSGMLIVTVSLILGAIATTTAYTPKVSAIDPQAHQLTLKGPVGTHPDDDAKPFIDPAEEEGEVRLTAELLEQLRTNSDAYRVPVKEFTWGLWDGKWWFVVAVIGLIAGAMLMRFDARQKVQASVKAVRAAEESPAQALRNADQEIRQLITDLDAMRDESAQLDAIINRIGSVQRSHFTQFVDARPELIGRLGLTHYSQLMDHYAGAERAFNRAWSAAADGIVDEARLSLREGLDRLGEAMRHLQE